MNRNKPRLSSPTNGGLISEGAMTSMEGNIALREAPARFTPHQFHIPVMGTGFTIDTPLKVARYGIDSVVALLDDVLIEQMRKYHCELNGEPYEEIARGEDDARARRITAYLNLLDKLIRQQTAELQASPFEPGSEITKYFEMLPEGELRLAYEQMRECADPEEKLSLQEKLRPRAIAGSIDVNIMTKADFDKYKDGEKLPPEQFDAMSALRGFALSDVEGGVVMSAGMNPRLYGYLAQFPDFIPDAAGRLKKRIILKVSDFRSAEVQGRFLAKRGLWVSEFRVESGLNCGGHAFASKGNLLGPVLMDFKLNRDKLADTLHQSCSKVLKEQGNPHWDLLQPFRVTVQGGIGTAAEQDTLFKYYGVDGTGWGTPFLLVPEASNVDDKHLKLLQAATSRDVWLSDCSPMGVPFWNLRNSDGEQERHRRITASTPGSPCLKKYATVNTEFTKEPICTASRQYQRLKLEQIAQSDMSRRRKRAARKAVLAKSCICHDLAGNATSKYEIDPNATSTVCCGPSIAHFSRVSTLREMVGHIYGRESLLNRTPRLNMFYRELLLNVHVFREDVKKLALGLEVAQPKQLLKIREALLSQIDFYRRFVQERMGVSKDVYLKDLSAAFKVVERIPLEDAIKAFTRRAKLAGQTR